MDMWIDGLFNNSFEFVVTIRVLLALILGFVLGFERELYKRPAGLRTHILVCVASCLIMLVSMYGFGGDSDPARLAAQVVSGIGFLGAGAIIRGDGDKDIKGITTAATIWMSAMLGLACGNGFYFGAILTTVLTMMILTIFRKFEVRMVNSSKYKSRAFIIIKMQEDIMANLRNFLMECNLLVSDIDSRVIKLDKVSAMRIVITFERDTNLNSLYDFIDKVDKAYSPLELRLSHE